MGGWGGGGGGGGGGMPRSIHVWTHVLIGARRYHEYKNSN